MDEDLEKACFFCHEGNSWQGECFKSMFVSYNLCELQFGFKVEGIKRRQGHKKSPW